MSVPIENQSQFEQIYEAIANRYPAVKNADGDATVFQFAAGPEEATWQKGNDIAAYNFANSVSQSLGGFFTPGSGGLVSAYTSFIDSIAVPNHNANPQYQSTQALLQTQRSAVNSAMDQQKVAWATYVKANTKDDGSLPMTFAQWQSDAAGGLQYADAVTTAQATVTATTADLAKITQSMDKALSDAQAALANTNNQSTYLKADGSTTSLPTITISGDLNADTQRWQQYPDDQYDLTIPLEGSSTTVGSWKTVYDTKVQHDCLTTSTSASVDTARIITDENYKLTLKMKGFASYDVSYGGWYNPAFVNPDVKLSPGTLTADDFFGPSGSLHLTTDSVWVAYRPKIEITVSTTTYKQQFEANTSASVMWLDLFSFRFKVDGSASLQPVESGKTTTITIDSPSTDVPMVFGVLSSVHFNGDSTKD